MTKLAVLIDPGKGIKTERVLHSVLDVLEKRKELSSFIEVWVGDTGDFSGRGVRSYIDKLKKAKIKVPIVIFPGNPFQVCAGADYILIPDIPNLHSSLIRILVVIGKLYILFRCLLQPRIFPKPRYYCYIVLDASTKIGRRLKSNTLSDEQVLEEYRRRKRKGWGYVYIEAGSGAKTSIANRLSLIRKSSDIFATNQHKLIVGGGIRTPEEVEALIKAHADLIVVSTVLEETSSPKSLLNEFMNKFTN